MSNYLIYNSGMRKVPALALGTLSIVCIVETLLLVRLISLSTSEGIKQRITLPFYSFTDVHYSNKKTAEERQKQFNEEPTFSTDFGLVSAQGTWMSDTELANEINTVKIDCWKEFGHCFAYQAEVNDFANSGLPLLYLGSDLYEIREWSFNKIVAVSETTMGCFKYELTFDRIRQTVTSVRTQTSNKDMCEGTSDKPLLIYLSDRFKEKERDAAQPK